MAEIPMVRLQLEYMRESVAHAISLRSEDIREQMQRAVDGAIEDFNFDYEVRKLADGILRESIAGALRSAFSSLQYDEPLRKALVKHMLTELERDARGSR